MSSAIIRPYLDADAAGVARLLVPLGYAAASAEDVHQRITRLKPAAEQAIFVAELNGQIAGWIHVCGMPTIVVDPYTEVRALIVDPGLQRAGIGRALMHAAEQWALASFGASRIRLSSNLLRRDAHEFYEHIGYVNSKTSLAFEKHLGTADIAKGEKCTTRN